MAIKTLILFLGLCVLAPESFALWLTRQPNIRSINNEFGSVLASSKFPATLVQHAKAFVTENGDPIGGISADCLRLWMEGLFISLVANAIHPVQPEEKSLFLSGYGGNGATVFNLVKGRVNAGKTGVLVLLPAFDGSRGNNGFFKGTVNSAYDTMEAEFRKWNNDRVKIITITDRADFEGEGVPDVFTKIDAAEKARVIHRNEAKEQGIDITKDEKWKTDHERLIGEVNKYYTNKGPSRQWTRQSEPSSHVLLSDRIELVLRSDFDICFEGYIGQGFDPKHTAVTYPVLDFLVALPENTIRVSLDYPVGWTDGGFQKAHPQYRPRTMIVIFLQMSIVAKDDKDNFGLAGIKIVQIDWNTVASILGVSINGFYRCPPPYLLGDTKVHAVGFTYSTLVGMTTDDDKAKWEAIASPQIQPTQQLQEPAYYVPYLSC